jgi:hypothetical protein
MAIYKERREDYKSSKSKQLICERRGYARSRIGLPPKGNMQQETAAIMETHARRRCRSLQ